MRRNNGELGLEIPIELMAALGGARHAIDWEGGLVIKGHSIVFIPVKRYQDSIQWHIIKTEDDTRFRYSDLSRCEHRRASLSEVDYDSIGSTRTFLGWWEDAEYNLGTPHFRY